MNDHLQSVGAIAAAIIPAQPEERQDTCERHGEFTSRNPLGRVWTKCPTCAAEARKQSEAEQIAKDAAEAAERHKSAWLHALGSSGIPLRFQSCSLKNYRVECDGQRDVLEFAVAYADEFKGEHSGRGAIFLGNYGTGKTHLSCGIALRIMHRYNRTAIFTTVDTMARTIRESKSFSGKINESQAIALYTFPDLLILDEVGIQSGTDTEHRSLFAVVNGRYENRKPTILLSNLTLDEIKIAIGDRLYSRLKEDGCEVKVFDWQDARGVAA